MFERSREIRAFPCSITSIVN